MPYVTVPWTPRTHQISFDEILSGLVDPAMFEPVEQGPSITRTTYRQNLGERFEKQFDLADLYLKLCSFSTKYEKLYEVPTPELYHTFYIPKRNGKKRRIDAPKPELMKALRELSCIFYNDFKAMWHTAAYAYIPKRSTVSALEVHQRNESKWFLKTDFSNFFGNTTLDFTMHQLSMIWPFSGLIHSSCFGRQALEKALQLCFIPLENEVTHEAICGLPQGTPISPMLTNLIMIPIDHYLYKCCREQTAGTHTPLIYTRYADDILISSKYKFEHEKVVGFINDVCTKFEAPYTIKDEKTRFGSSNGHNFNLGLCLNAQNEITIGHQSKAELRGAILNFAADTKNNIQWNPLEAQQLLGKVNYAMMVEKKYWEGRFNDFNRKFGFDIFAALKKATSY